MVFNPPTSLWPRVGLSKVTCLLPLPMVLATLWPRPPAPMRRIPINIPHLTNKTQQGEVQNKTCFNRPRHKTLPSMSPSKLILAKTNAIILSFLEHSQALWYPLHWRAKHSSFLVKYLPYRLLSSSNSTPLNAPSASSSER